MLNRGAEVDRLFAQGTHANPSASIYLPYTDLFRLRSSGVPWHWHGEVEYAILLEGDCTMELQNRAISLQPGEGLLINANVLHAIRQIPGMHCRILTCSFLPEALMPEESYISLYVLPYTQSAALDALKLSPGVPWQKDLLGLIMDAQAAHERQDYGDALLAWARIVDCWRLLLQHTKQLQQADADAPASARIRTMLAFIQAKYMEPITLADIAQSAQVSSRECSRCFQQSLRTTPIAYLQHHRVNAAATMLLESEESITDICFACGFRSTSYFAQVFKALMGCPPREYRAASTPPTGLPPAVAGLLQ